MNPRILFKSILIMAVWGVTSAMAGDFNEKTIVTFSSAIEIPGRSLPAGTYVFKLIDSSTQNAVVQVFDEGERQLLASFLSVADHRLKPAAKTVLMFDERPSDTPEAVKAVFYHGETYGRQFVYPHDTALAIARRTHQKVLERRDENGKVETVDQSGVIK